VPSNSEFRRLMAIQHSQWIPKICAVVAFAGNISIKGCLPGFRGYGKTES